MKKSEASFTSQELKNAKEKGGEKLSTTGIAITHYAFFSAYFFSLTGVIR